MGRGSDTQILSELTSVPSFGYSAKSHALTELFLYSTIATFPLPFNLDLSHPVCFFISPSFSSHLSISSLAQLLYPGVAHGPVGHRHQAGAFLQTPAATGRHRLPQQPGRACHGPAGSAAGCHPQTLLQTKMVSSNLDLGFFRCQGAQMRLSAPSHHVGQIPAPLRVLGSLGSPLLATASAGARVKGLPPAMPVQFLLSAADGQILPHIHNICIQKGT